MIMSFIMRDEEGNKPMPTLYLICGLPGSGKTSMARKIEQERSALRLSPDEWMEPLYGANTKNFDPYRSPVEAVQWSVAERVLRLGLDVVLEYGFWSKRERLEYRLRGENAGASVKLLFLDIPFEELWRRLEARNADLPPGTLPVSRSELETWSSWFERPTSEELGGTHA